MIGSRLETIDVRLETIDVRFEIKDSKASIRLTTLSGRKIDIRQYKELY